MKIGFIGQGWIGKNYADDFERRGFDVVRYAIEKPYVKNKDAIADCDIVFIAVPTPTTPKGFDFSIVRSILKLIGKGKTAVVKSTLLPGTTEVLQKEYPEIYVVHSPEFLTEMTAAYDAANPLRNIIGLPINNKDFQRKAKEVLTVLPKATFELICYSREAEMIKYAGNCFLFTKVVFMNMLFDLSQKLNCDWHTIRDAMVADPRIGKSHMDPLHQSGRGAGGHCFIKDFAAFSRCYEELVADKPGIEALKSFEGKNNDLLIKSNKDLDLLEGVYGPLTESKQKNAGKNN